MKILKYYKEEINEIKNSLPCESVNMKGFHDGLLKLKKQIEKIYDEIIFHTNYALDDAPYHGWTGDSLKNMRGIDNQINKRLLEVYAIVLKATNTEVEEGEI